MDEKEVIKEKTGDNITEEATEDTIAANGDTTEMAAVASDETKAEGLPTEIDPKKRLHKALIRAGAAFLTALVLLFATSFSVIDLIKGAKEADAVQDEEIGAFVKRDVFAILGFIDAETDDTGAVVAGTGEYAVVPMGGKFVTVHFTKRYLESAATIETETYSYINQSITTLDSYVKVEGTTEKISEELSTKMYDWFTLNKDWMVQAGVIADTTDVSTYLSDVILEVDTVNGMSQSLVYVLTGLAAVCVLYIIVELILMATGFYLNGTKKKKVEEDDKEDEVNPTETEETSDAEATESTDTVVEAISSEETSEESDAAEAKTVEGSEIQEDK